jgi:hypothetical protein
MIFKGKSAVSSAYVESYILAKGKEAAYLIARYNASEKELEAHFNSINNGGDGIYKPTKKQLKIEEKRINTNKMIESVVVEDLSYGEGTAAEATITFAPYDPDVYATRRAKCTPVPQLIEYAKCDPVAKKMIKKYKKVIADMIKAEELLWSR